MICHKHKCIFIHIPKTAGTSIEKIFESNGNEYKQSEKHLLAQDSKRRYRRHWKDYVKFSIVRNPWARLYSVWYNYRDSGKTKLELSEFIDEVKKGKYYLLTPQVRWLRTKGKIEMDFIERFEDIPDLFENIMDRFNLKMDTIPNFKLMEGKADYKGSYTDETIEKVFKMYNEDIEMWGYTFEGENNGK
jgi:chondroitin 4-sulfotransferase 11